MPESTTVMEKTLQELKEVLPEMKKIQDYLKGENTSPEAMKAFRDKVDSIQGDMLKIAKGFTDYMKMEKVRAVTRDQLTEEEQLDYIKFAIAVFKQGKSPHSEHEKTIKEVQDKYPGRIKAGMTEGTAADGGYVVPTGFSKFIWRVAVQTSVALQEAQIMPLTTGYKLPITRIDQDVSVYFENEAADISSHYSKPTLTQDVVSAKKLMGHVILSNELLEDEPAGLMDDVGSTSLIDWIINLFGQAMGQKIDDEAFNGAGTNFTGIMRTSGVNKVIMNHGDGGFEDVNFDYLSKMVSQIAESQIPGSKFYLSRTVLHCIRTLKDNNGNYLWQAASGADPATIWGYQYRVCDKMPQTSASAVSTPFMFFGNMKKYLIGSKGNMTMRFDSSIKSFTDESVLFVRRRIAMCAALPAAFSVLSTNSSES